MGIFSFLFGNKSKMINDFKARGAVIIDVRSKGEYADGAIPGSKNIALPQLHTKAEEIKKMNKPVITCCASGMRSSSAAAILKSKGIECMNGGGWFNLSQKLN